MDVAGVEESLFAISSAKLHGAMCQKLCSIVCKVLRIFPGLEAARPRSKPGIQALCSLHVALEKAKSLLQHCSDSSKLYLAITGDSVLLKFEKAKGALEESLRHVEDIVSQANGCQILEIIDELERTVFVLDQSDKQIGDEVIVLLQQDRKHDSNSIGNNDLEVFHRAASRLGITSSRAALTERRALKRLIERARIEEDKHKESIVAYLLHLMRKYSKVLRSEFSNSDSLGGYASCSPPVHGYEKSIYGSPGEYPSCSPPVHGFEKSSGPTCGFESELLKFNSFTINPCGWSSADMPIAPEEFRCPISLQLMYDPVIVSSGQTYERVCIEKWFADGHSTCPKTQQHLSHLCLTPNYCVKGLIASWCDRNEIPIPSGPPESLNLNYGRLTSLESETADSENFETCKLNEVKVFSLEESKIREKPVGNEISGLDGSCQETEESEEDVYHRYATLLAVLRGAKDIRRQCEVVEHIRFLLEHDEEARIYISANEFTEMLVQFLRLAIHKGDEKAQDAGAMALVNLAMNNNRNKEMILSAGVFPLLEEMIHNSSAYKSATALFLNLSSLEKAKFVIGSGRAISFFVHLLQVDSERQCKLNALHTLYNLSTHPANISYLLSADIVSGLDSLLADPHDHAWAEKSIAILINLAASKVGKTEIISAPGLISVLASVLESGELLEQELAASCLLILCKGDEKCSQIVLQEGVIPALVSLSVNGTLRGTEKAQKLLMLFREQRQRDTSPVAVLQPAESNAAVPVLESHALCKSKTRKMGRTWTSLWKRKNFSLYQC